MAKRRAIALLILAFLAIWVTDGRAQQIKTADRIVLVKSTRTMMLMRDGAVLKTYKVALGTQPVGRKEREGDHKTPEGDYIIDSKVEHSRFNLALHISYPNANDRERARKLGVNPGGLSRSTGLRASTLGLAPYIARSIGRTGVLQ